MDTFEKAFELFKTTGIFKLINGSLTPNQIRQLKKTIQELPKIKNSPYQIFLNEVELKLDVLKEVDAKFLKTSVDSQDLPFSPKNELIEFDIAQMSYLTLEAVALSKDQNKELESQRIKLEASLLDLLNLPYSWDSISLNNVSLVLKTETYSLSNYFQNIFLKNLSSYNKSLKEFGFEASASSQYEPLIEFLKNCSSLNNLYLCTKDNIFLCKLLTSLIEHPSLQRINLIDTKPNLAVYQALSNLLDNNYYIETVNLPVPSNDELLEAHRTLIKRLSISASDRFMREQVTQEKLIRLAVQSLKLGNKKCFITLLEQPTNLRAINHKEREVWVKHACEVLPEVYRKHPEHMYDCALIFKINLQSVYKTKESYDKKIITVEDFLLKKAFAAKDAESLVYLLDSSVNLCGHDSEQNKLLMELLKKKASPSWQDEVLQHLEKDERISTLLNATTTQLPEKYNLSTEIAHGLLVNVFKNSSAQNESDQTSNQSFFRPR